MAGGGAMSNYAEQVETLTSIAEGLMEGFFHLLNPEEKSAVTNATGKLNSWITATAAKLAYQKEITATQERINQLQKQIDDLLQSIREDQHQMRLGKQPQETVAEGQQEDRTAD